MKLNFINFDSNGKEKVRTIIADLEPVTGQLIVRQKELRFPFLTAVITNDSLDNSVTVTVTIRLVEHCLHHSRFTNMIRANVL